MRDHDVLPTLDWGRFVAAHWDRRPVRIRDCGRGPFLTADVLRAAARAAKADTTSTPYAQFTIERAQQTDPRPALPRPDERALDTYARRLRGLASGRRHALIVNRLHCLDAALWRRERDWFAALWRHTGLPSGSAITTLFHGNYEHSPIGVHKDRFATFMFVLRGRKRMRFWPQCPWREPVATVLDYSAYLPGSFAVELGPGEALYWPASYYHVGETVGEEPATSVNVGIAREEQYRRYDLDDLLADALPPPEAAPPLPACVTAGTDATRTAAPGIPDGWRQALADLRRHCAPRAMAKRAACIALSRYGAGGFEPAPAAAPRRVLRPDDRISLVPGARLLWSADSGGSALVGANGHATETRLDGQTLSHLIDALHEGRTRSVRALLRLAAGRPARDAMRDVLSDLVAWRALRLHRD